MNGKELLRQYYDIKKEIQELETRIEKLKKKKIQVEHDSVTGSNIEFPYQPRQFSLEGYNYQEADRKEEQLERLNNILIKRKQKCEDLKIDIEEFISTIPDSRTRRVFSLRYVDGLNWYQIARRIERYDESYPRKVVHDKYLEGLE